MKTLTRVAAALAAVVALVGATVATAPPAEATSKYGTVTAAEAKKVNRLMENTNGCVTVKQVRKIIGGKGKIEHDPILGGFFDDQYSLVWNGKKGKKHPDFMEVGFQDDGDQHDCMSYTWAPRK